VLESPIDAVRTIDTVDHPAARAWRHLQAGPVTVERVEPVRIDRDPHAEVYRLAGAWPARCPIIAKRGLQARAQIERTIYEALLPHLPIRTLHYYGAVEEADGAHWWLFLEDAAGEEYSAAAEAHRCLAGRWLALVHTALGPPAAAVPLPDRGPEHYQQCLRATRDCIREQFARRALSAEELARLEELRAQCEIVEGNWDQVDQFCAGMPRTLIHGDFSYKNVRVRPGAGETTLLVYDWESAGLGVPAVDLAHSPLAAPHFAAQADLTAYWEAVRDYWPCIDLRTIEQWANLGTLFRCLAALNWDIRSLKRGWAQKLLKRAGFYQEVLAHTLRAAAWVG
jgi:hypothetical protein